MFVVVTRQVSLHLDRGARFTTRPVHVLQGQARAEVEILGGRDRETHHLSIVTADPEHLRSLARVFGDLADQFEAQLAAGQTAAVGR